MRTLVTTILMTIASCIGGAQQDSVYDMLPLSVGNRWTYGFTLLSVNGSSHTTVTDTGVVEYQIGDWIVSDDSIRWQFSHRRQFFRYFSGNPTPQSMSDSATFEIVEKTYGRHELYTPQFDRHSAFPFEKSVADSAKFFRYASPDSGHRFTLRLVFPDVQGFIYSFRCTFDLKKDTGITRSDGYQFMGFPSSYTSTRFTLQGLITSIGDFASNPASFSLEQNYPNPFNSSTEIRFVLPASGPIELKVFDPLGRLVATLASSYFSKGEYTLHWNAGSQATGLYFYRLQGTRFVSTRKMLLLK